jgi:hypothetical protein
LAVGLRLNPIQAEEDDAGAQSRALISVNKRMVAAKEEKIGSRHLDQVGVNGLASEAGLGGRHRRLEQGHFPDSSGTAELAYGLRVYL